MPATPTILRSDALALPLADDTVDLVVTSPPYFGLRSYTDGGEHYAGQVGAEATPVEFVDALIAATREAMRVLKPTGSLWVNLGDKYASYEGNRGGGGKVSGRVDPGRNRAPRGAGLAGGGAVPAKSLMGIPWRYALRCIDDLGLILRAEVVWSKPNGLPESVTDRVRRSHETWFHFTLQQRYYANVDAVREQHMTVTPTGQRRRGGQAFAASGKHSTADGKRHTDAHPLGKLPGSVRTVPTEPLRLPDRLATQHFAAFPTVWPAFIIKGWCPPGGVVLDPFGGTGTTAHVAHALGRTGVSVDMSADYCRVAADDEVRERRVDKVTGRVRRRPTAHRQPDALW